MEDNDDFFSRYGFLYLPDRGFFGDAHELSKFIVISSVFTLEIDRFLCDDLYESCDNLCFRHRSFVVHCWGCLRIYTKDTKEHLKHRREIFHFQRSKKFEISRPLENRQTVAVCKLMGFDQFGVHLRQGNNIIVSDDSVGTKLLNAISEKLSLELFFG